MVPAEVLQRVFLIKASDAGTGTAFTITVDGREYLVTARHVIDPAHRPSVVHVFRLGAWEALDLNGIWSPQDPTIDVCVISLRQTLFASDRHSAPSTNGLFWGQDTFFLGFPYGQHSGELVHADGHPIPFIKKATLSAMTKDRNGKWVIWLDGHGNEGFSGGPVAFRPMGLAEETLFSIGGIVWSYQTVPSPVQLGDKETAMSVRANTGFLKAHDIAYAVDGARALGNGPSV